jgi:hypothetical protein
MNLFFNDENGEIISIIADSQPYKIGDIVEIGITVSELHKDLWNSENKKNSCVLYKIIKIKNKIKILYSSQPIVTLATFFTCTKIEKEDK